MIKAVETEHYIFHFLEGSLAERDIEKIAAEQERCFAKICSFLEIEYPRKISYWLYDSPQVIGDIFWDGEWCCGLSLTDANSSNVGRQVSLSGDSDNLFTVPPYSVHAAYGEDAKCTGEHEDTHVIAAMLCEPKADFLSEGLAMYMDGKWWGEDNLVWTKRYLDKGELLSTERLIMVDVDANTEESFYDWDCAQTYPVAGAWTQFVMETYGAEKFKQFYCSEDFEKDAKALFGCSLGRLHELFVDWIRGRAVTG